MTKKMYRRPEEDDLAFVFQQTKKFQCLGICPPFVTVRTLSIAGHHHVILQSLDHLTKKNKIRNTFPSSTGRVECERLDGKETTDVSHNHDGK